MNAKSAPYQVIIRIATLLLLVAWIVQIWLPTTMAGGWLTTVMITLAVVILGMVAVEAWQVTRRLRAGQLFFLRTITFYTNVCLAVLFVVLMVAEVVGADVVSGGRFAVLVGGALFLGFWSQTYPYVYLDSVRLTHRMGITTTTFPLFGIEEVAEEEDGLFIRGKSGVELMIFRSSLTAGQYARIKERLLAP